MLSPNGATPDSRLRWVTLVLALGSLGFALGMLAGGARPLGLHTKPLSVVRSPSAVPMTLRATPSRLAATVQQLPSTSERKNGRDSSLYAPPGATTDATFSAMGIVAILLGVLCLRLPPRDSDVAMGAQSGRKVPSPDEVELDVEAVGRYLGATLLQFGLITATLCLLDKALPALPGPDVLQNAFVVVFLLFTAVRSRVFSPLDNSRPSVKSEKSAIDQLLRPSWMPPPIVFPIVWSTIALLRTAAGYLLWVEGGRLFATPPLLVYFALLSIGDTWNTINNVEKRQGTAVVGVTLVWASALLTNYVYYQALPLAGLVLAPQSLWLTVAAYLVYSIWKLNGAEPLYPYRPRS